MTQLTISGLAKRFGDVAAIDNLNLEIKEGELISLLGPSGCGKTTTLRCIAGFEQPDEGQIMFDNKDIIGLAPERRNIGMVFQSYALFPHMTVRQNLNFGLEMRSIGGAEAEERIGRAIDAVQLTGMTDRYPQQLSGGQQQRVALARALVIEPSILLLDEPLANLDAKLREEMRFFIKSLQKRVGITTVYVTHDQGEAMVISDRIVVMFNGVIAQMGDPTTIYSRPASKKVAGFIGQSNFIDGTCKGQDDASHYTIETSLGDIICLSGDERAQGERVTIVVRPEVIKLEAEKPDADRMNSLPGKVEDRFSLGNFAGYKVACADGSVFLVQEEPWTEFGVGDHIWCSFAADKTWLIQA